MMGPACPEGAWDGHFAQYSARSAHPAQSCNFFSSEVGLDVVVGSQGPQLGDDRVRVIAQADEFQDLPAGFPNDGRSSLYERFLRKPVQMPRQRFHVRTWFIDIFPIALGKARLMGC